MKTTVPASVVAKSTTGRAQISMPGFTPLVMHPGLRATMPLTPARVKQTSEKSVTRPILGEELPLTVDRVKTIS